MAMKIISTLRRLFDRRPARPDHETDQTEPFDLFDHPELRNLSLRERADLPLNRSCWEARRAARAS